MQVSQQMIPVARRSRMSSSRFRARSATATAACAIALLISAGAASAAGSIAIASGPGEGSSSNLQTVTFGLFSQRNGDEYIDFGCKIDANDMTSCHPVQSPKCIFATGNLYDCTQTKNYYNVSEGAHVFVATASTCNTSLDCSDPSNWSDGPSLTRTFTIDRTAPAASFTSGPTEGSTIKRSSASFVIASTEAGSLLCDIDGAGFDTCKSPLRLSKLKNGKHTLIVKPVDAAGNTGIELIRHFKVKVSCKKIKDKRARKKCQRIAKKGR